MGWHVLVSKIKIMKKTILGIILTLITASLFAQTYGNHNTARFTQHNGYLYGNGTSAITSITTLPLDSISGTDSLLTFSDTVSVLATQYDLDQVSSYTVANSANNRVITSVDADNGNAEANLTFDGSTLGITGGLTTSGTNTFSGLTASTLPYLNASKQLTSSSLIITAVNLGIGSTASNYISFGLGSSNGIFTNDQWSIFSDNGIVLDSDDDNIELNSGNADIELTTGSSYDVNITTGGLEIGGIETITSSGIAYFGGGANTVRSTDPVVNVYRNITSGAGNSHAFSDATNWQRTTSATAYNSFDARITVAGSTNYDHYNSFQSIIDYSSYTGTISSHYGHTSSVSNLNASGTITNYYGFRSTASSGSGTVGKYYGFYAMAQTLGSDQFGFYSENGVDSRFGGKVGIGTDAGDQSDIEANLHVKEAATSGTGHYIQRWETASGGLLNIRVSDLAAANPEWGFLSATSEAIKFFTNGQSASPSITLSGTNQNVSFGGTLTSTTTYSTTVGATNRDLYIDNTGLIGYVSSFRDSKTNIDELGDVSWLYDLKPATYNYRKKDEEGNYTDEFYSETEYGLIAEEVEEVNDNLVFYDVDSLGNKDLRGVHYSKLIVPIIQLLQDQNDQIKQLEAKIEKLKIK